MSDIAGLTVEGLIREERDFLHELSNQLVIAQGMVNIAMTKLKKEEGLDPAILDKQQKAADAIRKQATLIKERRNILYKRS